MKHTAQVLGECRSDDLSLGKLCNLTACSGMARKLLRLLLPYYGPAIYILLELYLCESKLCDAISRL
jgi:hypothetical protein